MHFNNSTVRTFCSLGVAALLLAATGSRSRSQVLNGNFSTGDLTDWTVFTTSNGTANAGGSPDVQVFNTTGSGATDSAHFNVGQVSFVSGSYQGGGIFQNITLNAGPASFSADIAANQVSSNTNAEGGDFQMLLDGVVIASDDIGTIPTGTIRGVLSATDTVTAGSHQLEFEITRPFLSGAGSTPDQYITDVVATGSQAPTGTPEPGSVALLLGGSAVLIGVRRRARG